MAQLSACVREDAGQRATSGAQCDRVLLDAHACEALSSALQWTLWVWTPTVMRVQMSQASCALIQVLASVCLHVCHFCPAHVLALDVHFCTAHVLALDVQAGMPMHQRSGRQGQAARDGVTDTEDQVQARLFCSKHAASIREGSN